MSKLQVLFNGGSLFFWKLAGWVSRYLTRISWLLKGVRFDSGLSVQGWPLLFNNGQISIGRNVQIHSARWANPVSGNRTVIFCEKSGSISIGEGVGISNAVLYSRCGIEVGSHTMIGAGTKIYDTDFHSLDPVQRQVAGDKGKSRPVKIGKHVFIGADCIILKGTIVGDYAVIGAGSVVSGCIPEGEIWAGNPANFIRKISSE